MLKELQLLVVSVLHLILMLCVILVPFSDMNYLLLLHLICTPFMMLHWLVNENICFLSLVEKKLRKELYGEINDDYCFSCKLVEPVYDFKKNNEQFSTIIYGVTLFLWFITIIRFGNKINTGEISSYRDIFLIDSN